MRRSEIGVRALFGKPSHLKRLSPGTTKSRVTSKKTGSMKNSQTPRRINISARWLTPDHRSTASTGLDRRFRQGNRSLSRESARFSTGCGWLRAKGGATSIPIGCQSMPIVSGGVRPGPVHSGCRLMSTAARLSDGLGQISGTCTAVSSRAPGKGTTLSMAPGGRTRKSSHPRRSAPCSGRSRAGRH